MSDTDKLKKRRDELLEKINNAPHWVIGSVVETTRKFQGRETPFYYLSQSLKGKNKITYISSANLDKFKKAAAEGTRVKELIHELSAMNVKLMKAEASDD